MDARYRDSGAERFGISIERFREYLAAVLGRYGLGFSIAEQRALIASLHVEELMLARACSDGIEDAWREFLARYRGELTRAAIQITRDDAAGRELADELYAELYGLPNREGRRASKLDFYMGRGSLAGWLRSVLIQRHVDRSRCHSKEISLEEQMDAGVPFAAKSEIPADADPRVTTAIGEVFSELTSEERFLLASYYLDGQKLAAIGRQLGMHESTVSRKLEKLTKTLRKQIRRRLLACGIDLQACNEMLDELDVRNLNVDVRRSLQQESKADSF
jgi:RNA polymerase sigma-70 factor (ECF subfamily)